MSPGFSRAQAELLEQKRWKWSKSLDVSFLVLAFLLLTFAMVKAGDFHFLWGGWEESVDGAVLVNVTVTRLEI
jgi:hypothetical protein